MELENENDLIKFVCFLKLKDAIERAEMCDYAGQRGYFLSCFVMDGGISQ